MAGNREPQTIELSLRPAQSYSLFLTFPFVFSKKRLTIEMTWGETEYTQAKGKRRRSKQSRCFALTSNDLLDAAWRETTRRQQPNVFCAPAQNHLLFLTFRLVFSKKRLTIELTWGETEFTQVKV